MKQREVALSILIPTRNRAFYAMSVVRSMLAWSSKDFELVVQDNSDGDRMESDIELFRDDPRLRYAHCRQRLDMTANFEAAAELATGRYLAFLGDDDGVNREAVDAALWAGEEGLDALVPSARARYYWPDHRFRYYGGVSAGSLELGPFSGRVAEVDPAREMRKCIRAAGSDFFALPRVYYGLIRRDCLKRVKAAAGRYFPGPSPDLAGSIAAATTARRVVSIDYPLFIPGTCGVSMGGLGAMKKHVGELSDFPHLPASSVRNWSVLVPRYFSGNSVWAQNVVEALTACGKAELLGEFNVARLHALCLVGQPEYARLLVRSLRRAAAASGRSVAAAELECLFWYLHAWSERFVSLGRRVKVFSGLDRSVTVRRAANIEEAELRLVEVLEGRGQSFRRAVGREARKAGAALREVAV